MNRNMRARQAMHAAERHAKNMEEGNPFALDQAYAHIEEAESAYLMTTEVEVARRLHVAIDRMNMVAGFKVAA